jgi:hypothetical protein
MQMEAEECCQLEAQLHQPYSSNLDAERCAGLYQQLLQLAPQGHASLLEALRDYVL